MSASGESTEIEILKPKSSTPCPDSQNKTHHLPVSRHIPDSPSFLTTHSNSSLNSVHDSSEIALESAYVCPSSLPSSWSRMPSSLVHIRISGLLPVLSAPIIVVSSLHSTLHTPKLLMK